jgi:hypothetical protein
MARRVIITGGTGLIGRRLANDLASAGYEVVILTRNPQKQAALDPVVRRVQWDGRTTQGWGELVEGATAIVNLAGERIAGESIPALLTKRWTPAQKQAILQSRLDAGQAVVEAVRAARQKPELIIQASAVGYYGSRGDEELVETSAAGSDFPAEVCRQWEAATQPVETLGVRRAVIRTAGVVMSLEGGAFPLIMLPFKFFAGGPLGDGKQWFSWMHVDDEVGAIRHLIETPTLNGVFNLCAPQQLRNREFSQALGKVMNRPAFIPTPAFAFYLAFGEQASVLFGSQRQSARKLEESGFKFRFPQVEAALRDLLK